jgi:cell division cycle 2-like
VFYGRDVETLLTVAVKRRRLRVGPSQHESNTDSSQEAPMEEPIQRLGSATQYDHRNEEEDEEPPTPLHHHTVVGHHGDLARRSTVVWDTQTLLSHGGVMSGVSAHDETEDKIHVSLCPHENIIEVLAVCTEAKHLVMPLMDCHLGEEISSNADVSGEHLGMWILHDILSGVAHMHRNGIAHRDIKPQNVLLRKDLHRFPLGVRVALCDFGSAHYATDSFKRPNSINQRGTLHYMAPEALRGTMSGSGGPATDMWSVGCVMGEMLTGRSLFATDNSQLSVLCRIASSLGSSMEHFPKVHSRATLFDELSHMVSPSALSLLVRLLALDVKDRITAEEALRHPFFSVVNEYYAADTSGTNGRLPSDGPNMTELQVPPMMELQVQHDLPDLSQQRFAPIAKPTATSVAELSQQFCSFNSTDQSIRASALRGGATTRGTTLPGGGAMASHYMHCSGDMTASNQRIHRPLFDNDSAEGFALGMGTGSSSASHARRDGGTGPHQVDVLPLSQQAHNAQAGAASACKFLAFDSPQRNEIGDEWDDRENQHSGYAY